MGMFLLGAPAASYCVNIPMCDLIWFTIEVFVELQDFHPKVSLHVVSQIP